MKKSKYGSEKFWNWFHKNSTHSLSSASLLTSNSDDCLEISLLQSYFFSILFHSMKFMNDVWEGQSASNSSIFQLVQNSIFDQIWKMKIFRLELKRIFQIFCFLCAYHCHLFCYLNLRLPSKICSTRIIFISTFFN